MIKQLGVRGDSAQVHRQTAALTVDNLGHYLTGGCEDAVGEIDRRERPTRATVMLVVD